MIITSLLFFTALVAGITYFLTRKDDHDSSAGYFLGGRRLGGVVIAGSLLLTNLSTEQIVGLNGAAFKDGFSVMAWEVIAVIALVAMALFFLPRFLKSGVTTVPEFLGKRFDHGTHLLTTLIFLIAYTVILLPIVLYTGARGLNGMVDLAGLTGIESQMTLVAMTVVVVGVIGSVYALWGGLRTVAVSDTLNGAGLLVGGMLIVYFALTKVGDGGGVIEGIKTIQQAHPERFNSIANNEQSVPFGTLFTGVFLLNMFYWTTNQQIIQRTLGARNLREGQKGVLLCGAFKLLGPIYLVIPGIIAYHLYANDPTILPDMAYGQLVHDVLPASLAGFFVAVMVGAILSSYNSALNSACTLFSIGIYKNVIRKDATEHQIVRSGKIFGLCIAIISMIIAPLLMGQDSIFGYLQKMNGLYFIPIFAVIVVGLLAPRVPSVAAKNALVIGLLAIAFGYFVPVGQKTVPVEVDAQVAQLSTEVVEGGAPIETEVVSTYVAGDIVHDFHYLGIVFASLVTLMLVIGLINPQPEKWVQQHTGDVDITPWRLAVPAGVVLLLLVLTIYVLFADFSIL
jgi:SSS family solute:Na+ symporter